MALEKSTEVATSGGNREGYTNLFELIAGKFTADKTIALLNRSASLYAANASKMGEWVNFLQTSFANLLYEGSVILKDARDLDKLKAFFVSQVRGLKTRLAEVNEYSEELSCDLRRTQGIVKHLEERLHEQETINSQHGASLNELTAQVTELQLANATLQRENSKVEQEDRRVKLINEVLRLRSVTSTLTTQKQELLDVIQDFEQLIETLEP